jgi:hypothetical protein
MRALLVRLLGLLGWHFRGTEQLHRENDGAQTEAREALRAAQLALANKRTRDEFGQAEEQMRGSKWT